MKNKIANENNEVMWGKLSLDWNDINEIVVYGCGNVTEEYFCELSKDVNIKFFIDNAESKHGKTYNGIPIYSFDKAKKMLCGIKIVIAAETDVLGAIKQDLEIAGFKENCDFTNFERFICEWSYKHLGRKTLFEVHTAVTTHCTFNCRKCNMFMPYYKNRTIFSFAELEENLDLLFQHIDYLYKYQLVGGEPFVNLQLSKFVKHTHEKYGNRIGHFRIISNGSVEPDQQLIDSLLYANCEIHISDYSQCIDYKARLENTIDKLKTNKVNVKVIPSLRWRDFGFPEKPCCYSGMEIKKHMEQCGTAWHGLINKRFYYCNAAWSAVECGLFKDMEDDYIYLEDKSLDFKDIVSFCLGDYGKQYNSFCSVCGGCGRDNINFVQAGEQFNGGKF